MDKELFVDSSQTDETEFPVLLMDWVEGITLDKYLRENLAFPSFLKMLAYRFSQLAQWLIPQPFAHGDLKPDNILVREDGTLVLVDYDGMYVPAMKGQKARELGSPDFRHPLRTENDFDEHIDDFPLVSTLLSLKAISIHPLWLEKYGASDRLLLSEKDYRDVCKCQLLKELFPTDDMVLNQLVGVLMISIIEKDISMLPLKLIRVDKPKKLIMPSLSFTFSDSEVYSTEVKSDDLEKAWVDEYGAKYSINGKRLLSVPNMLKEYSIREGTKVICDKAFSFCSNLKDLYIPESVIAIGRYAFHYCSSLISLSIPNGVISIGEYAFSGCRGITSMTIPSGVQKISNGVFCDCVGLTFINFPKGIENIGDKAFYGCNSLKEMIIPHGVKTIGKLAFANCWNLKAMIISGEVEYIGAYAFASCRNMKRFAFVLETVQEIGEGAFQGCSSLENIYLPGSLKCIGKQLFLECYRLRIIWIPKEDLQKFEKLLPEYKQMIDNSGPKIKIYA
jgi:serine/threonine protein kinase